MTAAEAKKDVIPLIKDPSILDIWYKDFFVSMTSELKNW